MSSIATDANDLTTAEAYRQYIQGHSLRLYGMRPGALPSEAEQFENLADIVRESVYSTAQPVIQSPEEIELEDEQKAYQLAIRNWSIRNHSAETMTVAGLVVADLTTERILYLHFFDSLLTVAGNSSTAFDLNFNFDTIRPLT